MLMPMRARQIWLLRTFLVLCRRSGGSSFSCVPQPISEVVVPSSRKPSMLQVLTNSSTCLGSVGDLRVAFAAVDHLHTELLREDG